MQELLKASNAAEASDMSLCIDKWLIATKDVINNRKKKNFTYETSTS